jgi:transposase
LSLITNNARGNREIKSKIALAEASFILKTFHQQTGLNFKEEINPLNPELNPICYLLALLAHHFLHVSRIRVKSLTLRLLMSYIYGALIPDVSRSHTTTQHSR